MNSIAGNIGNSYITYSLLKELGYKPNDRRIFHIKNIYTYDFSLSDRDLSIIKNECECVILILQDQIRVHDSYGYIFPYQQVEKFLSKVTKPVLVAGLGANSLEGYVEGFHRQLSKDLIHFLRFLSYKCIDIGIRGCYTEEVLHDIGVNNVTVIGCPSYYENGYNRVVDKCALFSEHYVSSSGLQTTWEDLSDCIFLQDKGIHELPIIGHLLFGSTFYVLPSEYDRLKNKRFFFDPDICNWKKSIRGYDFYVGTRVHGAILALNSGVPSAILNHDSRAREMSEFLNIPYLPEMYYCKDVNEVYELCDYSRMNREYNSKLDGFVAFLRRNSFEYKPLPNDEVAADVSKGAYLLKPRLINQYALLGLAVKFILAADKESKDEYKKYIKKYFKSLLKG